MSSEVEVLRSAFSTNTNWAEWAAAAVFWGLIGDIVVILIFDLFDKNKSWWEIALAGLASALIATGVWGESHFGHRATSAASRLQAILEKQAAEAERDANEAKLALEKYKAWRTLTPEQQSDVTSAAKPFVGTPFDFQVYNDAESIALMGQIALALKNAGWTRQAWQGNPLGITIPGEPSAGIIAGVLGLQINLMHSRQSTLNNPVVALANALSAAGLAVSANAQPDVVGVSPDAVHIVVGAKPEQ